MTPAQIVDFIHLRRLPLHSEMACQAALADQFRYAGVIAEREVRLGDAGIIDFLIGAVVLEIKIKGQRREIYRQCERYCGHDRIESLVLATNAAMGMPEMIKGKLILIAHLGRAWL